MKQCSRFYGRRYVESAKNGQCPFRIGKAHPTVLPSYTVRGLLAKALLRPLQLRDYAWYLARNGRASAYLLQKARPITQDHGHCRASQQPGFTLIFLVRSVPYSRSSVIRKVRRACSIFGQIATLLIGLVRAVTFLVRLHPSVSMLELLSLDFLYY